MNLAEVHACHHLAAAAAAGGWQNNRLCRQDVNAIFSSNNKI